MIATIIGTCLANICGWLVCVSLADASHRLNLFYLANDVIQNCKRKNAIAYRSTFAEILPSAALLVRCVCGWVGCSLFCDILMHEPSPFCLDIGMRKCVSQWRESSTFGRSGVFTQRSWSPSWRQICRKKRRRPLQVNTSHCSKMKWNWAFYKREKY